MSTDVDPALSVAVVLDYAHRVNFAFQQNAIPVIRRLEIRNQSDKDLRNVVCRFYPTPGWATEFEQPIAWIPAQSDYSLADLPVELNLDFLANLSEKMKGEISVTVTQQVSAGAEPEELCRQRFPLEVYAFDEWTGLISLPEILAAFVTPNLSLVEKLLGRSADLLGQRTESSSIDGYQAKSKARVYQILAAIYEAVREQGIRYCNPAASFEHTGQRVRFADSIMRSKLATCLDLALLFAGLIEQAGLRPLVLMHQGHAYAGCWLVEDSLSEPASDDLQAIRKRVGLEEIVLFETTAACEGNHGDFARAEGEALKYLRHDEIFECVIDIYRSRRSGIRPLPLKRGAEGEGVLSAAEEEPQEATAGRDWAKGREFAPEVDRTGEPATPEGRVEHWKQQLLDLTLRNRLLNFRETMQTIPLVCPYPEQLEDILAADESFAIREETKQMAGIDPRSPALQQRQSGEDPVLIHLTEEMEARRLRSSLSEPKLARRLLELYRRVRLENEESGANTLYLALGFLEWKETKESSRSHRAPLLLIPVTLTRKSLQHGFTLQRHDEEALINVTLLELLKRDFKMEIPHVNPPPEGELGVDVGRVFRLFQQAVKDMPGWEVHREVWLAQFSFSKFLLWKDLNDNVESLTKNRVVDHLVHRQGQPFCDEVDEVSEDELDERTRYDELFCPLDADSSQLAAVVAASRGKNFVLHGPPGTGKSQTIANLIAHCLALGKRVLFVAEKRAALEVVHRRLSHLGLEPFCLELHSSKAGKAEVLGQFGAAVDFAEQKTPKEWNQLVRKLELSRSELNTYVKELHRVYPNGMNAYQCQAWLIAHAGNDESAEMVEPLCIEGIENQPQEAFEALQQLCEDLQIRGSSRRLSAEAKEALRPFLVTSWTPDWEQEALEAVADIQGKSEAFRLAACELESVFAIDGAATTQDTLAALVRLAALLREAPALPSAFLERGEWRSFRGKATHWTVCGRRRDQAREALSGFDGGVLEAMDVPRLKEKFEQIEANRGFFSQIRIWFLLKPVRAARVPGAPKWKSDQAATFFDQAMELRSTQAVLNMATPEAAERFGNHWAEGEAEWEKIEWILEYGDRLDDEIGQVAEEDGERLVFLRQNIGNLLSLASDMLAQGKPIARKLENLEVAWNDFCEANQRFTEILNVSVSAASAESGYLEWVCELAGRVREWRKELQNWCRWQDSFQQARTAQLGPLLDGVEQGAVPLEGLRSSFERAYREAFLRRLITLSEVLREFWGDEHQKRIEVFNDLDVRYTKMTAQVVTARLAAELPRARAEACSRNTELGILQRERVKKARHKPVRKLLSEIPNIVPRLKPCFLMSPLSVAQYLDINQAPFDMVIFDEASQIPVWDAIGAIARGKQVLIVGDPRQLPPTNFFGRVESDEEAIDDGFLVDLESILDECLASGLAVHDLRWHYRSRNEGLIAFSNHHYYENKLHTFPSPQSGSVGVRWIPVPHGYYDKGKSRTNLAEAEAITAEVIRRLKDPALSQQTIGIVTFSQAQQTLVADKLDEARGKHPEIEEYFSDEALESVFVKNLENVQGDERDIIIFSIAYGPDEAGRVSMNFGPLNRSGGERRLNVAITRAKQEILVFSTLKSEQIDLSRTQATGAAHLKAYLEYAERGPRTLAAGATAASQDNGDSLFEEEVAQLLRKHGYDVHTRIGCSGYRIDLAVKTPAGPDRYVIGIECDGATYHRAATARDRDRLRQSVLENLGWRIHRIWSTDWCRDREKAAYDLLAVVAAAVEENRGRNG